MKTIQRVGVLLALTGVAACATVAPPPELLSARSAYNRAQQGPAAALDPADLHTAKETLDRAEDSFVVNGDAQETRDTAYVAERRAEIAESRARSIQSSQQKDAVTTQMSAAQSETVRNTSAALGRANLQLMTQDQQLQSEHQRREDAEKRAAQASADLARIGSVKQEARGMVITLSGSVLFASANGTSCRRRRSSSETWPMRSSSRIRIRRSRSRGTPIRRVPRRSTRICRRSAPMPCARTSSLTESLAIGSPRRASVRRGRSRTTGRPRGAPTTGASRSSFSRRRRSRESAAFLWPVRQTTLLSCCSKRRASFGLLLLSSASPLVSRPPLRGERARARTTSERASC